MTAQLQTLNLTPTTTLFAGLPPGTNNIYPRARLTFADKTVIALKAALDTKTVQYNFTLPANFAYRLDQFGIGFFDTGSVDTDNYENVGLGLILLETGVTNVQFTVSSLGDTNVTNVNGGSKTWGIVQDQRFGEVFWNIDGGQPVFRVQLFDNDATNNTDELSTHTWVSFLQYDIEQTIDVVVNAPQPVNVV